MKVDTSKLFSGSKSAKIELVLDKKGPFTGKQMRLAAQDRLDIGRTASGDIYDFACRCGVRFYKDEELAYLVGDTATIGG